MLILMAFLESLHYFIVHYRSMLGIEMASMCVSSRFIFSLNDIVSPQLLNDIVTIHLIM